jgi:hypothetical protein
MSDSLSGETFYEQPYKDACRRIAALEAELRVWRDEGQYTAIMLVATRSKERIARLCAELERRTQQVTEARDLIDCLIGPVYDSHAIIERVNAYIDKRAGPIEPPVFSGDEYGKAGAL